MKTLCLLLFVAIARGQFAEEEEHWSREIAAATRSKPVRVQADDDGNDSCDSLYSCQDCKTARVCRPSSNGVYEVLQTISCPADRPYCDSTSGSCVTQEPDSCGDTDDPFICMANGKFPDKNCTRFHACLDLKSVTFQCSVEGEKYNPLTKTCEIGGTCGTFDCATSQGYKVAHSTHPGYYAYCDQVNGPFVIDRCPENYGLNSTSQLCEANCKSDGIIPDVTDCHYYWKCTKISINRDLHYMNRERLICPTGQAYSKTDFICMPEESVASCKASS